MRTAIVFALISCLIGGVGLAIWKDSTTWFVLSVVCFCILYAG
jgi:hypothetical protein